MIFDTLSIASLLVILLVLILIFGSILYSHYTMKQNLKTLARNSILMNEDDEIRELCKKIMSINPNACPLIDGEASKLLKSAPDKLKVLLKNHLKQLES